MERGALQRQYPLSNRLLLIFPEEISGAVTLSAARRTAFPHFRRSFDVISQEEREARFSFVIGGGRGGIGADVLEFVGEDYCIIFVRGEGTLAATAVAALAKL